MEGSTRGARHEDDKAWGGLERLRNIHAMLLHAMLLTPVICLGPTGMEMGTKEQLTGGLEEDAKSDGP